MSDANDIAEDTRRRVAAAGRLALCKAVLLAGQPLRLQIRGSSMLPALWSGEWVTVHSVEMKAAKVGHIAVFFRARHFVAHRVVRIEVCDDGADGIAIVTRGDAADHDDSPVLQTEWLGVIAAVHRFGGARTLRLRPFPSASVLAALVRRSDLARRSLDRLSMLLTRTAIIR